jgi:hypothetical protein
MARNTVIFIVGLWLTFFLPNIAHSTGYALLIGIQDYPKSFSKLNGSKNDITKMEEILKEMEIGISITILRDKKATHTEIRDAFTTLSRKNIQPNDFVYIHYSGHGSKYPNKNPLQDKEKTGYDQTWVPYGARTGRMKGINDFDIIDDEIDLWLQPIFAKTGYVVIVSDSCHSGTATRGAIRTIPKDKRVAHPFVLEKNPPPKNKRGIRIGATTDKKSAFEDKFRGNQDKFRGNQYGVFTWYWAKALKKEASKNKANYWLKKTSWINAFKKAKKSTSRHQKNKQMPYLDISNYGN